MPILDIRRHINIFYSYLDNGFSGQISIMKSGCVLTFWATQPRIMLSRHTECTENPQSLQCCDDCR